MSVQVESFISVIAQHANLGDLVIRRNATNWARAHSERTHILATAMPAHYLDAYAFTDDCVVHSSSRSFLQALSASGRAGRSSLVFAPGPSRTPQNAKELARSASNILMARIARARGGSAIALGRAARAGSFRPGLLLERRFIESLDAYYARDRLTALEVGTPTRTIPDIALVDESSAATTRDYLALSFRYDHTPAPAELSSVLRFAEDRGLRVALVTQVRMDNDVHARLANALHIDHVDWPTHRPHGEQLRRVREIYSASEVVVTNRLHAALFGVVEGALPAVHPGAGSKKAIQTLSEYFPSLVSSSALLPPIDLGDYRRAFSGELAATRTRLNNGLSDARKIAVRNVRQVFDHSRRGSAHGPAGGVHA